MTENKKFNVNIEVSEDDKRSDDDDKSVDEDYSYSEDSLSSDDFTQESEVTSVTHRSSLSDNSSIYKSKESSRSASKISDNQDRSYTSFGSTRAQSRSVNQSNRRNMSFTNMEMMRIERDNQYLLRKIMAQQKPTKSAKTNSTPVRLASSAINRRKLQRKIDEDNIIILRKIQSAKSSSLSGKTVPGYKFTSLK